LLFTFGFAKSASGEQSELAFCFLNLLVKLFVKKTTSLKKLFQNHQ